MFVGCCQDYTASYLDFTVDSVLFCSQHALQLLNTDQFALAVARLRREIARIVPLGGRLSLDS